MQRVIFTKKSQRFSAAFQIFPPKAEQLCHLDRRSRFCCQQLKMEEENPSFSLNLEFLEPQVEEENEIEQYKTDKEGEEFIKEQRNPKMVKKTEVSQSGMG